MGNQLLVRMYNIGLGDCIYVRVPDQDEDKHILIDCGNKFSSINILGQAIADLEKELPKVNTAEGEKRRLDLLVVTHPHEDHHKGFEPRFFENIKVENLWLSPGFIQENPKAKNLNALTEAAGRALTSLKEVAPAGPMSDLFEDLLSLSKKAADEELNINLPRRNKISPRYASADFTDDFTQGDIDKIFKDKKIKLKVLGPMSDIDKYYLRESGQASHLALGEGGPPALFPDESMLAELKPPANISSQDFDRLRKGIQGNALALVERAGHAMNNLSVVLLIEWKGNRLLFPGDAEWDGANIELKEGGNNGSWNVMWETQRAELSKRVDFLKVGHHGSENATPWAPQKNSKDHPISQVLDKLLPLPKGKRKPTARALVSTERSSRWPSIPDPLLMAELGKRVANAEKYEGDKKITADTPQPQRTDLEDKKASIKYL
ncbi:MAG TPA: hypothetical protein VLA49_21800, partial [Anaerolineales bacterium]|nr:hypothetical protein [Anaerolineales bacterium]